MQVFHTLNPIYNKDSKILILGSLPSVKSRELNFYYAHPQNKFWTILSKVFNEDLPITIDDKINFLNKHHIALFDVIKSCDITGSSDSSIKNVITNDLTNIIANSQIKVIFTTGLKAYKLYQKYIYPQIKIPAISLPSTSPANAKKDIENILYNKYLILKDYTN